MMIGIQTIFLTSNVMTSLFKILHDSIKLFVVGTICTQVLHVEDTHNFVQCVHVCTICSDICQAFLISRFQIGYIFYINQGHLFYISMLIPYVTYKVNHESLSIYVGVAIIKLVMKL